MSDIIKETQKEVARLRDMISTSKALLPNSMGNFAFYEMAINEAEKAIRHQDTVSLVRILPELRSME